MNYFRVKITVASIRGNLIYGRIQFILLRPFETFLGEPNLKFPPVTSLLAGAIMGHHFRTGTPGVLSQIYLSLWISLRASLRAWNHSTDFFTLRDEYLSLFDIPIGYQLLRYLANELRADVTSHNFYIHKCLALNTSTQKLSNPVQFTRDLR